MIIKNGKITETTEEELYSYWLKQWSDLMPFDEYMRRMENLGVNVIKKRE
jgi:hypothetical protein